MRLTRVAVEGVGRFGTFATIEGLGPGVNILSAGNEAGKSTIFRAIRACLFERHSTRNADVLALATESLSLPVSVILGFEHEGKSYELAKSFIKSPAASLKREGVEIARNREADELVWEILGITPGSGRSVDEAAFGILWVSQGQSFHVPEPSEAATSALNSAISQEVGTLVGGERARQVMALLQADLSKQLTDGGKPRKDSALDKTARQAETLATELQATEQRLRDLDASLDELARLRAELRKTSDPAETQRLKTELEEARQQLKAGEEAAAILQRCEVEERQAHAMLTSETGKLEALRTRIQRIDDNRRRCKELNAEFVPLDKEEFAARNAVSEAYAAIREIDEEIKALDQEDVELQRVAALGLKASRRDGFKAKLDTVQDYVTRLARTEAALKANGVKDEVIRELDEIERDMATLMAKLEAAAAQVTIESRGGGKVSVNGQHLEANIVRAVTEPLAIRVGDEVSITITPPQASLATAQKHKNGLQQKLLALLAEHGVAAVTDLRRLRAERAAGEDALRGLKAERAALGLKLPPAEEIAGLEAELAAIDGEVTKLLAERGIETLPSPDDVEARRAGLRHQRAERWSVRVQREAGIKAHNANLARIGSTRGTAMGQLKELATQLAADVAALPDNRRQEILAGAEQAVATCDNHHRIKAAAVAEKQSQSPSPEEIERRGNRVARLVAAIDNRDKQIAALGQRISHLEGQVQTAGGDGLGERAADLRAEVELAEAERTRQAARIETLKLLRDVVVQCYEKRREQLNAPLKRHLGPFLNDVFPQAEIELGDGFSVSGLRRNGPGSELFERLSAGTQEQIAVLVRLAMGAMIAERGNAVPVIFDDALVFSDYARIEQKFDALNRAGKFQQVIVLTCRSRAFASLGGRQLTIS